MTSKQFFDSLLTKKMIMVEYIHFSFIEFLFKILWCIQCLSIINKSMRIPVKWSKLTNTQMFVTTGEIKQTVGWLIYFKLYQVGKYVHFIFVIKDDQFSLILLTKIVFDCIVTVIINEFVKTGIFLLFEKNKQYIFHFKKSKHEMPKKQKNKP